MLDLKWLRFDILLVLLTPVMASAQCQWPATTLKTVFFHAEYPELTLLQIEFDDDAALAQSSAMEGSLLARYRAALPSLIDTDPRDQRALLRRQRVIFAAHDMRAEVAFFDAIRDGALGEIRGISCLEALLYEQLLSINMRQHHQLIASEFIAFTLKKNDPAPRTMVLFATGATDSVTAAPIMPRLRQAVSHGWRVEANLHNHPFFFGNPDIAGTITASARDIDLMRRDRDLFEMPSAMITNGFSTWEVSTADL